MTDQQAFAAIRGLGLTVGKRDGEYRVNFPRGQEATAYYTNDRSDAVATALAMVLPAP